LSIRRITAESLLAGSAALALALSAGCSMFGDDGVPKSQRPSNGWQVEFSETAQSDGSIEFLLAPKGGSSTTVSVPVGAGQTDNEIAAVARGAFETALGNAYRVAKDRDAVIHVSKATRQQPDFALTVVRITAQNVRLDLDRE
jgi:hypothetical protein